MKRKATLLYSYRISDDWLFSSYVEFIHKEFDKGGDVAPGLRGLRDRLFLTSTYLKRRLSSNASLRLRYIVRLNNSNSAPRDYTSHLFSVGFEREF